MQSSEISKQINSIKGGNDIKAVNELNDSLVFNINYFSSEEIINIKEIDLSCPPPAFDPKPDEKKVKLRPKFNFNFISLKKD